MLETLTLWLIGLEALLLPHVLWFFSRRYRHALTYVWQVYLLRRKDVEEEGKLLLLCLFQSELPRSFPLNQTSDVHRVSTMITLRWRHRNHLWNLAMFVNPITDQLTGEHDLEINRWPWSGNATNVSYTISACSSWDISTYHKRLAAKAQMSLRKPQSWQSGCYSYIWFIDVQCRWSLWPKG